MYDTRQEANEFVGESLDEARAKAAEFYGVDEGDLRIAQAPEGEIFGTAGRCVIVAAPKGMKARSDSRGSPGEIAGRGGKTGANGAVEGAGAVVVRPVTAAAVAAETDAEANVASGVVAVGVAVVEAESEAGTRSAWSRLRQRLCRTPRGRLLARSVRLAIFCLGRSN